MNECDLLFVQKGERVSTGKGSLCVLLRVSFGFFVFFPLFFLKPYHIIKQNVALFTNKTRMIIGWTHKNIQLDPLSCLIQLCLINKKQQKNSALHVHNKQKD